jgi:hypothetical protein
MSEAGLVDGGPGQPGPALEGLDCPVFCLDDVVELDRHRPVPRLEAVHLELPISADDQPVDCIPVHQGLDLPVELTAQHQFHAGLHNRLGSEAVSLLVLGGDVEGDVAGEGHDQLELGLAQGDGQLFDLLVHEVHAPLVVDPLQLDHPLEQQGVVLLGQLQGVVLALVAGEEDLPDRHREHPRPEHEHAGPARLHPPRDAAHRGQPLPDPHHHHEQQQPRFLQ